MTRLAQVWRASVGLYAGLLCGIALQGCSAVQQGAAVVDTVCQSALMRSELAFEQHALEQRQRLLLGLAPVALRPWVEGVCALAPVVAAVTEAQEQRTQVDRAALRAYLEGR